MNMDYTEFDILDQHVLIQYSSFELHHMLAHLLRSFTVLPSPSADPDLILSITTSPDTGIYNIACEGRTVGQANSLAHGFRLLEWQLDMFLSAIVADRLLLHAGAVASDDCAIILPGTSGSGKSSLTLALLLAGYDYLSDELAVIDASTAQISTFPKPLSIKNRDLFVNSVPDQWFGPNSAEIIAARQRLPDYQPVWYIHADDLPVITRQTSVPACFIIFPTYAPDLTPRLLPLNTNDTLQLLIENSVNFPRFAGKSLGLLSSVVANAVGYRLESNSLDVSVQLVNQLMAC